MTPGGRRRTVAAGVAAVALAAAAGGAAAGARPDGAPPPALVTVHVRNGLTTDRATGVVVGPGRVLTVAHVLGDRRRATVTLADGAKPASGRRLRADASVLRVDAAADAALLSVPGVDAPRLALAPPGSDDVELHGREVDATPRRATFTDVLGTTVRRPVLELRAAVARGDSGSPVLDDRGRLAGLVFAADEDRPGIAWATAADGLRPLLR